MSAPHPPQGPPPRRPHQQGIPPHSEAAAPQRSQPREPQPSPRPAPVPPHAQPQPSAQQRPAQPRPNAQPHPPAQQRPAPQKPPAQHERRDQQPPAGSAPQQPAPPQGRVDDSLNPVSSRLIPASVLGSGIVWLIVLLVAAIPSYFFSWWILAAVAAVCLVVYGLEIVLTIRQVKAMGYRERDEDLIIRRGILVQSTTVVPYGRLQYVEVSAGPVQRMFGIAKLELHTASASTDAHISGLPRDEAHALRDRLSARGRAHLAGL